MLEYPRLISELSSSNSKIECISDTAWKAKMLFLKQLWTYSLMLNLNRHWKKYGICSQQMRHAPFFKVMCYLLLIFVVALHIIILPLEEFVRCLSRKGILRKNIVRSCDITSWLLRYLKTLAKRHLKMARIHISIQMSPDWTLLPIVVQDSSA